MTAKKANKRKVRFLEKFCLALNILLILGLLCAYSASYVSPVKFWPLAFFGLAYPVLMLLNLFFVLFWLFLRRYFFLFSLLTMLAGWKLITHSIEFNTAGKALHSGKSLKVMSFNVRLFDYYNWRHNKGTRDSIIRFIQEEAPDIICFQEFFDQDDKYFPVIEPLVKAQKAVNYHVDYSITLRKTDHYGIGTFSAYPIVARGAVKLNASEKNYAIYSDILFGKDTLRIYNVHLESIRFSPEDYMYVTEISETNGADIGFKEGPKKILTKLKRAFLMRAPQAELIERHVRQSPYPVVLCGDFNDTPASFAYHTLSASLKDAFDESGSGIGNTYAGKFPSFRIDYIFYDDRFTSASFKTHRVKLSDHYPVTCILEFNPVTKP